MSNTRRRVSPALEPVVQRYMTKFELASFVVRAESLDGLPGIWGLIACVPAILGGLLWGSASSIAEGWRVPSAIGTMAVLWLVDIFFGSWCDRGYWRVTLDATARPQGDFIPAKDKLSGDNTPYLDDTGVLVGLRAAQKGHDQRPWLRGTREDFHFWRRGRSARRTAAKLKKREAEQAKLDKKRTRALALVLAQLERED